MRRNMIFRNLNPSMDTEVHQALHRKRFGGRATQGCFDPMRLVHVKQTVRQVINHGP